MKNVINDTPLDAEEKALQKALESGDLKPRDLTTEEFEMFVGAARETLKKDQRINIRLSSHDLLGVKRKASELGLPYQSLISGLIHQFVEGELVKR